jgi:Tol biopolymer transport system component
LARELNPELPAALEEIIRKALERDRKLRFGTAAGMLDALKSARAEIETRSNREIAALTGEQFAHKPRRSLRWAAGALVIVLLAAAGYLFVARQNEAPQLRISDCKQITHDGHEKFLTGTDGSRLYFTQLSPLAIEQVGITGGEVAQLPVAVPGDLPVLEAVSPDGLSLPIASNHEGNPTDTLWNVPALGGPIRRLANALEATFSPDGNSVAYASLSGDLWLVRSDGSDAHKLASAGGQASRLVWSPDGGVIRFTRDNQLWEISSSGSNLHQLLPKWHSPEWKCCGRWTLDGTFYLFLSSASGSAGGQIWALDERRRLFRKPSAEPVQLTTGPVGWSWPVPGKDGKSIFSEGVRLRGELVRFDTKTKQYQPFLGGVSAESVSFSNDGRLVAYVTFPDGNLWRANRDGSDRRQLSSVPLHPLMPRWSPDNKQIAFMEVNLPGPNQSYIVASDGGSPQKLLPDDKGLEGDPNWSTDGSKIAFTAGSPGDRQKQYLSLLDLATHKVTILPGSVGKWSPRWSPDGRYISALSSDFLSLNIFDTATQQWSALPPKSDINYTTWSRDSKSIYYLHLSGGNRGVFRIRVTGGEAERIADLKDWHLLGHYGFWMGLDPTDAPLLLRDTASDDIYALTLEEK